MKNKLQHVDNPLRDRRKPTTYSSSKTIPGQSLLPADLLKRHLAGTLPDIDQSERFEYHYDENGNQINEPMPLEMHELHKLAVAIRKRQFEEATEQRKAQAIKFRQEIIDEYKKTLSQPPPGPDQDTSGDTGSPEPKTKRPKSTSTPKAP